MKENTKGEEKDKMPQAYLDKEDNSLVRSESFFQKIFEICGLEILHQSRQPDYPKDLMNLTMWVLKPMKELEYTPIQTSKLLVPKEDKVNKLA